LTRNSHDPPPSLLTTREGPSRQRTLFEWNIPGNSHIPQDAVLSNAHTAVHNVENSHALSSKVTDQCVLPEEDPNRPVSLDVDDEEGDLFDMMGDGVGDEDDGGENEPEGEEGDTTTSDSQRKRCSLPPAVQDAYDRHLQYLKQVSGPKSRPHLYEIHQTFWLPQKANFFMLNSSNKPRPSQLYGHRWFYWDPDYLVEGGLHCPNCKSHLHRHGFTRPRRVVDLQNVFYMIGQRHRCPSCRNAKSNNQSVTFNSWDPKIVKSLPASLAAEFPAHLSHRNAIADPVLALMRTCFQFGMGSKQFSNCLQGFTIGTLMCSICNICMAYSHAQIQIHQYLMNHLEFLKIAKGLMDLFLAHAG